MTAIFLVTHETHWTNYLLVLLLRMSFTSGSSFGFFRRLRLLIVSLLLFKIIGVRVFSQIQLALSLFYLLDCIQVFFCCRELSRHRWRAALSVLSW